MRSGGGAFGGGPAAQVRAPQGRGRVGHVERADVGAGRNDLVDLVEDMVALLIDGLRYGAGTCRSAPEATRTRGLPACRPAGRRCLAAYLTHHA
jgi:hypothetical protein